MWTLLMASLAILFATLYLLLRRAIFHAREQVQQIVSEGWTNEQTVLTSPDGQLENLLVEVNRLLSARQRDRIIHEQEMERLRREMAHISHDLRTPLTAIIGYAELLGEEQLSASASAHLQVIEKRAKALRQLINSLYELSRLESIDYPINRQSLDLRVLLERALAQYYSEFTAAGFEMTIDIPTANCMASVDEDGVMRVYMNVLQNVLKHGERSIHIFQGWRDGKLVTTIANEARSLQKEEVSHLFERGFTGDKSRTEGSSGLGLAVVRALMEQMGGQAYVAYQAPVLTLTLEWETGVAHDPLKG